jgi:hypothetical protein
VTDAPPTRTLRRELLLAWLHLAVLWSFAVARPLLQVLEDSPEFFVARGNTSADIIIFALALVLIPATLLVLCEALLFRLPAARRTLHLTFVGLLLAAIVLQIVGDWGAGPAILIVLALLGGAAGALAYDRTRVAPGILTVLSPAPFAFVLYFLLISPVAKLVLPQDEAAASTRVSSSTPVVLVVFDEFSGSSLLDSRGAIDRSRFPHFAALARDATWYRNATTVADMTTEAVPAILTGSRPEKGLLPIASDHPQNLFTVLGEDYSLNVTEPATSLCPESLCRAGPGRSASSRLRALVDDLSVVSAHLLLPEEMEGDLPAVDRAFSGFRTGGADVPASAGALSADIPPEALNNRAAQFGGLLAGMREGARRPGLHFLHVGLPHSPWEYLPTGQAYPGSGEIPGLDGEMWTADDWPPTQGYQRYLLQLGFVDRLIGRLMRRLHDTGLYDRAIVVVTADHGLSFRPGLGRRSSRNGGVADIVNVPLFVKTPGQDAGEVNDGPARTIDILPTIADTLDVRLDRPTDGAPLPRDEETASGEPVITSAFGGELARLPFEELMRRRNAEVRRRIGLFGEHNGFDGVFRAGPDATLVGRPVSRLARAGPPGFRVAFDYRAELSSFSPDSPVVPAFVTGRVEGAAEGGQRVAIALNGRVAAVTETYRDGDVVRLAAILPGMAFREGANVIEALAVTGSGPSARVASAGRSAGDEAKLVERGGDLALELNGKAIAVEPGHADGFVDSVQLSGGQMSVAGWATAADHSRSADRVLLFGDGRLLQSVEPTGQRPDLSEAFGPGAGLAGYEFTVSTGAGVVAKPGRVRVIALAGSGGSELATGPNTFP